ncbi:uncharacterized protein LOC109424745 [Aedes albopictus]|uniref:Ionotropic glutamate receptor L-glutamate and glycine-binding domain-containing protein n=1 Tax=Aedes albopictus TaxID=7160 RepID=A0ABM1YU84_AEDAL
MAMLICVTMLVRLLMICAGLRAVQPGHSSLVESTVSLMLRDFRHTFAPSLMLLASTTTDGGQDLRDVLEEVVTRLEGAVTLRLDVLSEGRIRRPCIRTVMLIDGYEAFRRLYVMLSVERFDFSGRYLIVFSGLVDEGFARRVFGDLWDLQIINAVLVGYGANRTRMWTYFPYVDGHCAMVNLVQLKPSDQYFPDKTLTYHGCPFKVGSFETRPFTIMERPETGPLKMSGFEGDLLDTLKEKLNFTVQIFEPKNGEQWGYALPRNSTGMMRMIQEGEVDFGISCLGISVARSAILKAGLAHYTTSLVLAVPKGRPYTAFEKLFRPFQANVWWIIATVISGAAFIITSVELRSLTVRNFVYGQQTRTPYLNLIQVFFGIAMHLMPTRNFARTLLIFWIYFCFVMRSLYQSAMFRYLQQELTFPPSRSMAEIDRTAALYYVVESGERYYEAFPDRLLRVRHLPQEKNNIINRLEWMIHHPGSPDVVQGCLDHMAHHNWLFGRKGGRVDICPEFISTFTVTIYYPKKSMLTRQFDRQIQWIQASGLMSYWINLYGDYEFNRVESKGGSEPRQLSNGHLAVTYELCGAMFGLSLLVFALELASWRVGWMRSVLERLSGMGDYRE